MRFVLALVATGLSMALFGWAFPPVSAKPLAWVALAPFFFAVRLGGPGRALALGALWSVGAAWVVGDWMPGAVEVYFLQPRWVGFLFFLGIAASMATPYYAAFAWVYQRLGPRFGPLATPLLAAAAWVAAELGRGRLFTGTPFFIGNPWGLIGYTQVGWEPAVQIASITGVHGLGFAIAALNAGLAELALAAVERRPLRSRALALLPAAAPAVVVLVFGALVLRSSDSETPVGSGIPIAIVQGDVRLGSRWRSEYYGENLDVYLALTRQAFEEGDPRIVFWPEGALTFFLEDEAAHRRAIARVLEGEDAELLAGGPRVEGAVGLGGQGGPGAPRERYFNSIFRVTPAGETAERYDKQYLVPFSEYFPFDSIDLLRRRFERVRVFTPGGPTPPLTTRAGRAGVLVCNEAMLPEVAGARVAEGADYLLNPSNDTWIPSERFAAQLFAIVRLRAVEQRRFLVRVSTSGPSAVVDPWGRLRVESPAFSRHLLLGEVYPRQGRTVYGRVGDLFALLCVAAVAAALVSSRKGRGESPATR